MFSDTSRFHNLYKHDFHLRREYYVLSILLEVGRPILSAPLALSHTRDNLETFLLERQFQLLDHSDKLFWRTYYSTSHPSCETSNCNAARTSSADASQIRRPRPTMNLMPFSVSTRSMVGRYAESNLTMLFIFLQLIRVIIS